jgi:hypothetical protein
MDIQMQKAAETLSPRSYDKNTNTAGTHHQKVNNSRRQKEADNNCQATCSFVYLLCTSVAVVDRRRARRAVYFSGSCPFEISCWIIYGHLLLLNGWYQGNSAFVR